MDELVELVAEKTGLGKTQARNAVETVIGFLKDKLPDAVAAQLHRVLSNDAVMDRGPSLVDRGLAGLEGLLGKE